MLYENSAVAITWSYPINTFQQSAVQIFNSYRGLHGVYVNQPFTTMEAVSSTPPGDIDSFIDINKVTPFKFYHHIFRTSEREERYS